MMTIVAIGAMWDPRADGVASPFVNRLVSAYKASAMTYVICDTPHYFL